MSRCTRFIQRHKTFFGTLGFLFLYSVGIAFAVPPTDKYAPGATLDPNCAPGSTNCSVQILPDQTGNSGKYLTTDGSAVSWATVSGSSTRIDQLLAATATPTAQANSTFSQTWNWALTSSSADAFTFGESSASTGGSGDQSILKAATVASSTAIPLMITNLGAGISFRVNDETGDTDSTPFVVDASGNVGIADSSPSVRLEIGANSATNETVAVQSAGFSALHLNADTDNDGSEIGSPYIYFSQDAGGILGIIGTVQSSGNAPDGLSYTGTLLNSGFFGTGSTSALQFGAGGGVRATFDTSGNFGIGDTSPNSLLDIYSSAAANTELKITNENGGDFDPQIGFELVENTNTFTLGVDDSDSDKFKISTTALGTSDRFVIDSSGFIGIGGTSIPLAPLHVGSGTANNSVDPGVLISRNIDNTGSGNGHAFSDSSLVARSGVIGYNSFDARVNFASSYNYDHYAAFQALPTFTNSGTTTNYYGLYSGISKNASATITNSYAMYAANPVGAGTVTNLYGLYMEPLTNGATLNYAIYTSGSTISYFGGNVGIGDTSADNLLDVASSSADAGIAITSLGTDTDPYIKYELADGTGTFTMGVDDSDSDKFKISTTALGTGDRLTIDSSGYIAVPTNTIVNDASLVTVNLALGADDANVDTINAIDVVVTSANTDDADVLRGINIGNLTSADAEVLEYALRIGSGWDQAIDANGTLISLTELQALDGGIGTADITDGSIDADDLDQASADGAPNDEECLTYETSGGGDFEWVACAGLTDGDKGDITVSGSGATWDIDIVTAADGLSSTTSNGSGLESLSSGLTLLQGCANNEILKWSETADTWGCAADSTSAGSADLDSVYDGDADKELLIDSTTGLIYDMTTTGDFIIQDSNVTVATFDDSGGMTFVPAGTSDFTITTDTNTQLIISDATATAAAIWRAEGGTVDALLGRNGTGELSNLIFSNDDTIESGSAWQWSFGLRDGDSNLHLWSDAVGAEAMRINQTTLATYFPNRTLTDTGPHLQINTTLGNDADADIISGLLVSTASATTGDSDVIYGLNVDDLSGAASTVTETAIRTGTGWDYAALFESGYVGVGTTTPASKLNISGNLTRTSWTTTGVGLAVDAATFTDSSGSGTITTRAANSMLGPTFASSSAVTLTNAATLLLDVPTAGTNTTITNRWALRVQTSPFNIGLGNGGNTRLSNASDDGYALIIDSSRGINIGANSSTGISGAGAHAVGFMNSNNHTNISSWYNNSTTELGVFTNTGNFGVGDTTPDDLINIHSATADAGMAITSLGTDTDPYLKFELADGTATFIMGIDDSDSDKFKISTSAIGTNDRLVIDSSGFVGIAQSTPGVRLHVGSTSITDGTTLLRLEDANSTCNFTADTGSPSCGSDLTLKKDIETLDTTDLLERVAALRPVSYHWNTDDESAPTKYGFIAQEVAEQFPDLVSEGVWVDGTNRKFLNTGALMPYVVGAVKEITLAISPLPKLSDQTFVERLKTFLSGIAERGEAVVDRLKTDELCLGETCVTETELKALLELRQGATVVPSNENEPTPPAELSSEEEPEPEPESEIETPETTEEPETPETVEGENAPPEEEPTEEESQSENETPSGDENNQEPSEGGEDL